MAFGKKKAPEPTPAELYEAALDAYEMAKLDNYEESVPGVVLKKGEHAHLVVQGVGFIEPKRLPSTWQGGSRGVSIHIAKGLNYRVGNTRGKVQPGAEVLQPTDQGTFVATNQRFLFVGSKRTTEWALDKLVGFSLDGEPGTAVFNVTNRQKPSGLLYGTEYEEMIEAVIAAVIARAQSPTAHAALLSELADNVRDAAGLAQIQPPAEVLRGELTSGAAGQSPPPPPPPGVVTEAGWHPDPHGRFEYRWWTGTSWTSDVSRGGQAQQDPAS